jgi:monofunctional biosynthetic peptidoglycan transglycosylase
MNINPKFGSIFEWIKEHKVKSFLYCILIIAALEYFTLPSYSIKNLVKENPKITAIMEQRLDENDHRKFKIDQKWVSISRISLNMVHAIIVAEDGSFYEHAGVDWYEVQESIERNLETDKPMRGASTISQQLAKNLYLSTSRDPLRKLKELIITLRMERILKKQRILELYLNLIEWGDGVFGVEAASQKYFGKPASTLDRYEAARLAAVVPSPLKHRPLDDTRWVNRKTNIILTRMEARGW